jgi:hypothetical protein
MASADSALSASSKRVVLPLNMQPQINSTSPRGPAVESEG